MADDLGIMLTELPEAESISDNDLFYLVKENNSDKVKAKTIKDSLLGDFYGEASGNPASFADGSESALVECKVEFEPKQDLHGYDKPWAGGAGKNKLPLTVANIKASNTSGTWSGNVYSISNCTFEILTDNDSNVTGIKVNTTGTASQNISFNVGKNLNYTEELIFSGCPSGGSNNTYMMYTASPEYYDTGNGITIQYTSVFNAYIYIKSGYAPNNLIFYPMLRLSTESSGFEPYANICPISGHSSVTINVSPTNDTSQGVDTIIQLGDTYYGGTLNVGKGELTIDRAIVDLGSFNWVSESATVSGLARVGVEEIRPLGAAYNQTPICSSYEGVAPKGYSAFNNGEIGFSNNEANPMIRVRDQNFASMTDAQIKSAMSGVTLCYELATPITVQITPAVIYTLVGQNYISADTGDVDVVYTKSTAFIKPNPSGEADGYLSSIELSGEKFEIIKELPTFPTSDGDYKLKLSVSSGVPTLSWVSDT